MFLVLSCALFINAVLYAVPHVLLGVMVWIKNIFSFADPLVWWSPRHH
jgi:hypothetical protein